MNRGGSNNKEQGRKALAWVSFVLAIAAGAAFAGTWVGGVVAGVVHFIPWPPLAAIFLAVAVVGMGLDIFNDGEPNQVALYAGMLLPSLARATSGKLSEGVTSLSQQLLSSLNPTLSSWVGTSLGIGLAIACAAVALVMARRVVAKGGGAR